jgi:hypothetical protein
VDEGKRGTMERDENERSQVQWETAGEEYKCEKPTYITSGFSMSRHSLFFSLSSRLRFEMKEKVIGCGYRYGCACWDGHLSMYVHMYMG